MTTTASTASELGGLNCVVGESSYGNYQSPEAPWVSPTSPAVYDSPSSLGGGCSQPSHHALTTMEERNNQTTLSSQQETLLEQHQARLEGMTEELSVLRNGVMMMMMMQQQRQQDSSQGNAHSNHAQQQQMESLRKHLMQVTALSLGVLSLLPEDASSQSEGETLQPFLRDLMLRYGDYLLEGNPDEKGPSPIPSTATSPISSPSPPPPSLASPPADTAIVTTSATAATTGVALQGLGDDLILGQDIPADDNSFVLTTKVTWNLRPNRTLKRYMMNFCEQERQKDPNVKYAQLTYAFFDQCHADGKRLYCLQRKPGDGKRPTATLKNWHQFYFCPLRRHEAHDILKNPLKTAHQAPDYKEPTSAHTSAASSPRIVPAPAPTVATTTATTTVSEGVSNEKRIMPPPPKRKKEAALFSIKKTPSFESDSEMANSDKVAPLLQDSLVAENKPIDYSEHAAVNSTCIKMMDHQHDGDDEVTSLHSDVQSNNSLLTPPPPPLPPLPPAAAENSGSSSNNSNHGGGLGPSSDFSPCDSLSWMDGVTSISPTGSVSDFFEDQSLQQLAAELLASKDDDGMDIDALVGDEQKQGVVDNKSTTDLTASEEDEYERDQVAILLSKKELDSMVGLQVACLTQKVAFRRRNSRDDLFETTTDSSLGSAKAAFLNESTPATATSNLHQYVTAPSSSASFKKQQQQPGAIRVTRNAESAAADMDGGSIASVDSISLPSAYLVDENKEALIRDLQRRLAVQEVELQSLRQRQTPPVSIPSVQAISLEDCSSSNQQQQSSGRLWLRLVPGQRHGGVRGTHYSSHTTAAAAATSRTKKKPGNFLARMVRK